MPDGVTVPVTTVLVALAFGLTFAVQARMGERHAGAPPAPAPTAAAPPRLELRLTGAGTVPPLRRPRRVRRTPTPTPVAATPAPTAAASPTATG